MRLPALEFGNAGLTRLYCDSCSKPVTICYQGLDGDYCSKACLDRSDGVKVKTPELQKVKTAPHAKVKTSSLAKVKMALQAKAKTSQASVRKVKTSDRTRQRLRRRKAIRRILMEIMAGTGREPTIAEVQSRLAPLGLDASVRTVWKDLNCCRVRAPLVSLR